MPSEPLMIGEVAARFGCSHRTLRYYEQEELVTPRRLADRRLYDPEHVARLDHVFRLRDMGFSVHEVRELLKLQDEGRDAELRARTAELALAALDEANRRARKADGARVALLRLLGDLGVIEAAA